MRLMKTVWPVFVIICITFIIVLHRTYSFSNYTQPCVDPRPTILGASTDSTNQITRSINNDNQNHNHDSTNQITTSINYQNHNRSNIIYGHLHIPKTGGTTLNGLMAAKYDRVCGNKGFSFDSYQANIRGYTASQNDSNKTEWRGDWDSAWGYNNDAIGYENCDYISREISWNFWRETMQKLNAALLPTASLSEQVQNYNKSLQWPPPVERSSDETNDLVLELHVPCRDPIDHLLSMANHGSEKTYIKPVVFNCTGVETDNGLLEKEVKRAYFDFSRFDKGWIAKDRTPEKKKQLYLRCFKSIPVEPYVAYMDRFLQTRRIPSKYFQHETNKKRNKTKECVHDLPAKVQDRIRAILVKRYPYMRFCKKCMGTEDELQL